MSASPQIETFLGPSAETAEPLYFGSGCHLFGWLHLPDRRKSSDMGVVICNPFGYEAMCSHRSVRAFAEAAAAIGVPALRFDYRGSGDSADIGPEADQIAVWREDISAAISELRSRSGVRRVCLLGFRFGALLAALAARGGLDLHGLMAIAPIVSGRRYLKELRTTRMASMLGSSKQPKSAAAEPVASKSAALEISGFSLSSATLGSLGTVDLCAIDHAPAPHVFVIDGQGLPSARSWADKLGATGIIVRYQTLPGMVEMLMTAPQFAVVPRQMIVAMQEWLAFIVSRPTPPNDTIVPLDPSGTADGSKVTMTLPVVQGSQTGVLTERAIRFGPDLALFGIVTEPPRDERRRRGVILLNPGVDHHIGASRLYVSLARKWSGRGYVVLRMDLAGIGDSATRPGNQDDDVFPASALDDIRCAIAHLAQHYNVGDISLAGLCSGAYHALRAAAAGIAVDRIMMINPQNYFWKAGMSLNDLQLAEVVRNPAVYRQQVLSATAWRRLMTGEVNVYRIIKVYAGRIYLTILSSLRDLARRLKVRLPYDLGRELEEIVARGVAIIFVFARGEPGLDLLKLEGGSSVKRLGGRCRVHILESGDHVFSHQASRVALEGVLGDELFKKAAADRA